MKSVRGLLPVVVAAVLLAALDPLVRQSPFFIYIASLVGVNVILAVSLNIVNGMTGQFSIGHAGFMAVGAYIAGKFSLELKAFAISGLPVVISDQLFFIAALLVGGIAAALCGFLVGLPSLRLRGDYLAIVTLGFGEIIRVAVQNTPALGSSLGLSGIPQRSSFAMVWFCVFGVVLFARRLADSAHGRSLFAIREDEVAAEAMGVDTTGYKVRAFVVSSFFAGVAGGLFAHFVPIINPGSFTFVKSMEVVVMVVAGGLGSTTGAILAAVALTLLPEGLRSLFTAVGGGDAVLAQRVDQVRMPIYGLLLVTLMLLRPQGLFGTKEIWSRRTISPLRRQGEAVGELAQPAPMGRTASTPKAAAVTPEAAAGSALLHASGTGIQFGGLKALSDFQLSVSSGDLQGLIGPNGAGKTTAFNVLTGVYKASTGEVKVCGKRVDGLPPHRINRMGLARTFQNIRLFKSLTALDNVRVACLSEEATPLVPTARIESIRAGGGFGNSMAKVLEALNNYVDWFRALLRTPGFLREEEAITRRAEDLLEVMGLSHRRDEEARHLPYGEQRRLEIARALGTRPKVLLLDEPAAGMNTREKADLMVLIRSIRDRFGLGILVIEHDMKLVMGVCERITVLDHGEMLAVDTPDAVRANPKVIEAYLGEAKPLPGAA